MEKLEFTRFLGTGFTCFPLNRKDTRKKNLLFFLMADNFLTLNASQRFPMRYDGRVLYEHPMLHHADRIIIANIERFCQMDGKASPTKERLNKLFNYRMHELAQTYGFSSGKIMMSTMGTRAMGHTELCYDKRRDEFYILCEEIHSWHPVADMKMTEAAIAAMDISMLIYSGMTRAMQLHEAMFESKASYKVSYLPLMCEEQARLMACSYGLKEFEYIKVGMDVGEYLIVRQRQDGTATTEASMKSMLRIEYLKPDT